MRERVVLIGKESGTTAMLYNALSKDFDVRVLLEDPASAKQLLRWRAKHVGWYAVFGQVLFQVFIAKPMAKRSRTRCEAIMRKHDVSDAPIPAQAITRIPTVNQQATWDLVRSMAPRAVVINGTRILSKKTIAAFGVPILNTHVGITPMYRGVHGAYWALVNNDRAHCGVTIHLVDEGIDTGNILHQALIEPTSEDDFTTYPVMQMAVGCGLMLKAVNEVIAGEAQPRAIEGESKRWYHPTLREYLHNRSKRGVR